MLQFNKHKLLLLIICLMLTGLITVINGTESTVINLYSDNDKEESIKMDNKESVGFRFSATTEFNGMEFYVDSANVSRSKAVFNIYTWNTDYKTTLSGNPLQTGNAAKFGRGTWIKFNIPSKPGAGEYLVVLNGLEGNVSLGKYSQSKENIATYYNGFPMSGCLRARLNYVNTPANPLGKLSKSDNTDNIGKRNAKPGTYVATDGLGRILPTYKDVGGLKKDRYVGMFFWTWHASFSGTKPMNVQAILDKNPEILNDFSAKEWGNASDTSYFWNEPIYGYYNGKDPWVFRKQAEMLADAGVDVLIFDNTNNTGTFLDGVKVLLETFAQARTDGVKTPQISFIMNFFESGWNDTVTQLKQLYTEIYKPGKYSDLWFYWKGKPLMMSYPNNLDPKDETEKEILEFFTFRPGQPSYTSGQEFTGQWGWLSIYPQQVYKNEQNKPEQITVGVAQNHNKARGLTAMNGKEVFGRTWSNKEGAYDTRENAKLYGKNFEEQFEYALEVDPEFIFVTGYNEWRAGRYNEWCGVKNALPDQCNDEYSRDIEPSKGDLKDHYYYQLCSFIRRYKGVDKPEASTPGKTIDINSDTDAWEDVGPYYMAYRGNTFNRDSAGYVGYNYTNNTGRNDIIGAKVTYDKDSVYFMVETEDALSPSTDPAWMRLLIDIEGAETNNWETFEYIVNRINPGEKATLEKSLGGWNWERVGDVDYSVKSNRLQIKIPRSMLGIESDRFTINFKWSDNMQTDGDIMDVYNNGDTAPGGRFKYQYSTTDLSIRTSGNRIWPIITAAVALLTAGIAFVIIKMKKNKK